MYVMWRAEKLGEPPAVGASVFDAMWRGVDNVKKPLVTLTSCASTCCLTSVVHVMIRIVQWHDVVV